MLSGKPIKAYKISLTGVQPKYNRILSWVIPKLFLSISRVLIDSAYTRDIPGINPGYTRDNLPWGGEGLGKRD
jgi:hypothetical protein